MLPGPGTLPTFLYYFAFTSLSVSLLLSKGAGIPVSTNIPYAVGMASGLVAGLLGTYFNRTIQVTLPSSPQTIATLKETLETMGYRESHQSSESSQFMDGYAVFERDGLGKLLSSRIFAQLDGEDVAIAGRAITVRQIQQQLSHNHTP
jgi:hypothetical protein